MQNPHHELYVRPTFTLRFPLDRSSYKKFSDFTSKPYACGRKSKGFDRPVNEAPKAQPLNTLSRHFSIILIIDSTATCIPC